MSPGDKCLEKVEEFLEIEATLLEDVRESAFGKFGMHRDDGLENLIPGAFF